MQPCEQKESIEQIKRDVSKLKELNAVQSEQLTSLFKHQDNQDKMIENLNTLTTNTAILTRTMESLAKEVGALKTDVSELKYKPAAKYDSIVEKITGAVISAIVGGYIAVQFFG